MGNIPDAQPSTVERQAIYAELAALARRARDAGLPQIALILDLAVAVDGDKDWFSRPPPLRPVDN